MKPQILIIIFSLFLFTSVSCDQNLLINVSLDDALKKSDYTLVDHNFERAEINDSENLHFEFILNKELQDEVTVIFYDASNSILATKSPQYVSGLVDESTLVNSEISRSYLYSVSLTGLKSLSLINKVEIRP